MNVQLIQGWRGFKAGHRFESLPLGQARAMIRFGFAEEVTDNAKPKSSSKRRNTTGNRTRNNSRSKKASKPSK